MTALRSFKDFKQSHLGLSRANMPQIKSADIAEYLQWLKDQGVKVTNERAKASTLIPTQSEFNQDKIDYLISSGKYRHGTVLVSLDNYIIDGHHRWAATAQAPGNGILDFTRIHAPIAECLALAHRFPKSFKKELHEMTETLKEANVTINSVTPQAAKLIAGTILNQIKGLDKNALMAWGAKNYLTTNGSTITPQVVLGPGIQFDVRGGKFKGRIIIGLNGNDQYDIAAFKVSVNAAQLIAGTNLKVHRHVVDVPVENLVSALDGIIG